jgi:hypothetical protein
VTIVVKQTPAKPRCAHCAKAESRVGQAFLPATKSATGRQTRTSAPRGISLLEAYKCSTGTSGWTSLAWSVAPPRACNAAFDECHESLFLGPSLPAESPDDRPPAPPPRDA